MSASANGVSFTTFILTKYSTTSRWPPLLLAFVISVWWLARPYWGFGHDALYYAADVLRRVGDDALNSDLFFGRGTQGDFSVYPLVYAELTRRWGIGVSAFALTLVSRFVWLAALITLCRAVQTKSNSATLAFSLSLLLPVYYDSHQLLSYGEPFETPRHWAEIAVMLSLASALSSRYLLAIITMVLGCAIHPLMGLPGFAAAVLLLPGRLRSAALVIALTSLVLLEALQVGPGAQLFHMYDDVWYTIVQSRNPMVLADEWDWDTLSRTAMWVFLLGTVAVSTPMDSTAKRLASALAWTSGILLIVWVTGSLLRNVLITQLQLFRVLWIAQLTAPALLLSLIPSRALWRASDRTFVALLAAALLSDLWTSLPLALLAITCRSGLPHVRDRLSPPSVQWIERSAYALFAIVALSRLARIGFKSVAYDVMMSYPHSTLIAIAREPVASGMVVAGLLYADFRWKLSRYLAVRFISIALPLAAVAFWTHEAGKVMRLERPDWSTALKHELPPGTTVYWDAGPQAIWMLLGRASYASFAQGAGALFSRSPAIELDRRLQRLEALRFIPDRLVVKGVMPAAPVHVPTLVDVKALCQDPPLDLVLLNGRKDGATQVFMQGSQSISIFRCADLRISSSGAV